MRPPSLVMLAIHLPVLANFQMILEVQQQVVAGLDAAGEEVSGHPIVVVAHFKWIRLLAMDEDVEPSSLNPGRARLRIYNQANVLPSRRNLMPVAAQLTARFGRITKASCNVGVCH